MCIAFVALFRMIFVKLIPNSISPYSRRNGVLSTDIVLCVAKNVAVLPCSRLVLPRLTNKQLGLVKVMKLRASE